MKKILVACFFLCALAANAQKTPPKKTTTASKPVAAKPLKNLNDSVSYAIGFLVANYYKNQQGIKSLNSAIVAKAVNDVYANKSTLLNENQCNNTLMFYLQPDLSKTIKASESFLEQNKKRTGVKTMPSGLQYEVITQGTGSKPIATDTVTVHYRGTLVNGTEFDNSYSRGEPISFPLNGVIPGWTEGLQYMSVGSKYRLFIPYQLGYGMNGAGQSIPGGSALIFEVELLKVNGKE
jgi:FKBP-type peptidyl-prolyl cis-trans isomerase